MDVKAIIETLVEKIAGDNQLVENFKKDPKSVVLSLLSKLNLGSADNDTLNTIINGIKAKIGIDTATKQASGILGKIKGLFGK